MSPKQYRYGRSFVCGKCGGHKDFYSRTCIRCAAPRWRTDAELRVFIKANVTVDPNGCWLWQKSLDPAGYGRVAYRGKARAAHRVAFMVFVGPITKPELDHLCRVPRCVNPEHLEPVTGRVNKLRGNGFPGRNARKTECPAGHPYDEANTILDGVGRRYCRTCRQGRRYDRRAQRRRAA